MAIKNNVSYKAQEQLPACRAARGARGRASCWEGGTELWADPRSLGTPQQGRGGPRVPRGGLRAGGRCGTASIGSGAGVMADAWEMLLWVVVLMVLLGDARDGPGRP